MHNISSRCFIMCRQICLLIIFLFISSASANPTIITNDMQLFTIVRWYQLEIRRLQLQHRMELAEYQNQYKALEERHNEISERLEATSIALTSARVTIDMQVSVIRRFVREDKR